MQIMIILHSLLWPARWLFAGLPASAEPSLLMHPRTPRWQPACNKSDVWAQLSALALLGCSIATVPRYIAKCAKVVWEIQSMQLLMESCAASSTGMGSQQSCNGLSCFVEIRGCVDSPTEPLFGLGQPEACRQGRLRGNGWCGRCSVMQLVIPILLRSCCDMCTDS